MAEENETPPAEGGGKKKGGMLKGNRKYYLIGGGMLLVVIFFAVRSSNSKANVSNAPSAADSAMQGGINPSTGYLYGSPADLAASGAGSSVTGLPGPAGPAGPTGPTGPAGPPGKTTLPGSTSGHPIPKPVPPVHRPVPKPVPRPVSRTYTVKPGDSLSKIASHLGMGSNWQHLYSMNRAAIGKNPNLIHPGLRLRY